MPRDVEQLQLIRALSLYINAITMNPPILVPATPEMLFDTEYKEEQDYQSEDNEYEYEYEEEEDSSEETGHSSSTQEKTSPSWNMGNRIIDLDNEEGDT
jgi:hypothetical protein